MKCIRIVKSVAYAPCIDLASAEIVPGRTALVPRGVEWHDAEVRPSPSMTIAEKDDDGNTIFTTTLKFSTPDEVRIDRRRLAFAVTLADGRRYLIGSALRPYPIIERTQNCPDSVTSSQLNEVVVTWKSRTQPPLIVLMAR